ncbi:DUF6457 domain-containing protein, partial [Streptomyces sp. SM14]|uniref:DUF6457 domain-containing protein n=2 Tax=unclassified Streptomyces TaxID=2593676 RepID=UPI000CD4EDFB
GGGPLAALAAGVEALGLPAGPEASASAGPVVLLLATDLPFLDPALLRDLTTPPPDADGVILTDGEGRDQPLTAAYRSGPLRRELDRLRAEHGGALTGLPLRRLLPGLRLRRIATNGPLDCDTWADIAAARARISDHGRVLEEWLAAVKAELDIDTDVDTGVLLDAARDAAHGVARPAAPLTTYLLGYAAARNGTDPATAARAIGELAARWQAEAAPGGAADGA